MKFKLEVYYSSNNEFKKVLTKASNVQILVSNVWLF